MTANPFPKRRTRSQIKLSDDIFKYIEHSPMKYARNVVRENTESQSRTGQINNDKDEFLPSPPKPSGSKRSVSPIPDDGYNTEVGEYIHGRGLKRKKLQEQEINNPVNPCLSKLDHSRTNSEPNVGSSHKAQHQHAGAATVSNEPNSMSSIPEIDTLAGVPGKARAQSVPLFPSSSSLSSFPSLDLRNPPTSPICFRSPSRAIDRFHGLKVHPSPPKLLSSKQLSVAEGSHNESRVPVDKRMILPVELPEVSIHPPESPAPAVPPHISSSYPATPAPSALSFLTSMSPLTPLPETPLPPNIDDGRGNRYTTKGGCSVSTERGHETGFSMHSIPQPNFGELKNTFNTPVPSLSSRSQIPRPIVGLTMSESGEATERTPERTLKLAHEDSDSFLSTVPVKNTKSYTKLNAIELLMQNASKQGASRQEQPFIKDQPIIGEKEETARIPGALGPLFPHVPQVGGETLVTVSSTASQAVEGSKQVEVPIPPVRVVDSFQVDKLKIASKKRGQSGIPTSTRVTRSALKPSSELGPPKPTRRLRANSVGDRKSLFMGKKSSSGEGPSKRPDDLLLCQSSPTQTRSPIRNPRTPGSSPAKISLAKTPSKPVFLVDSVENSPSPTKIAKAVSMFNHSADIFAMDDAGVKTNSSSLSMLSTALEKLKMPAPSRPNTSLGFNDDANCDDSEVIPPETVDKLRNSNSLKRSFTVGHTGISNTSSNTSSEQVAPSTKKPRLVQKPMTMFFARSGSSTSTSTLSNSSSAKQTLFGGVRSSLIGPGFKEKGKRFFKGSGLMFPNTNRRLVQKASRKTTLPTVEASPVKGSSSNVLSGSVGNENDILDSFPFTSGPGGFGESKAAENVNDVSSIPLAEDNDEARAFEGIDGKSSAEKGKEKEKPKPKDSSRRATMALSQLSQSLNVTSPHSPKIKVTMGPPATPHKIARSVSSTYPGPSNFISEESATGTGIADTATTTSSASPDKISGSGGKRFSARQAAKALNAEAKSMSGGSSGPAQKGGTEKDKVSGRNTESWGVLKDCRIFVDVRTDDGEEAGSLFMEMLENLGAKIQTRVGQACTHVIFKNGLMSTISRYRLLREPKPSVVGIAWVVECVEQRSHVEETPFLIDLSEMNVAGTNKRRRSMLPKLISSSLVNSIAIDMEPEDGGDDDVSIDSSQSSTVPGDDLTPLERARRRRSMIFGPIA